MRAKTDMGAPSRRLHPRARPASGPPRWLRLLPIPGAGRPAGVAPRHARCTTAPLKGRPSPAARAPGFPRGPRRSLRSRRPIILVDYPPLRAWARAHARLQVAARGEVAASVTRREGRRVASRRAPSRRRRAFRAASSSRRALDVTSYVTLPRGSRLQLRRGPTAGGLKEGPSGAVQARPGRRHGARRPHAARRHSRGRGFP